MANSSSEPPMTSRPFQKHPSFRRGAASRPGLALVCLAAPVVGALLWPMDFAAGCLALSFLPFYGALWFLPSVAPRAWQGLAVAALAALATWPLWISPRAALVDGGAGLGASWPRREHSRTRRLPNWLRPAATLRSGGWRKVMPS